MIFIFGGICDVTYRNPVTKYTSLRHQSPLECRDNYVTCMQSAHSILRNHPLTNQAKIVFGPICGIELNRFNEIKSSMKHPQQRALDKSIEYVNAEINSFTEGSGLRTPWLANHCHAGKGRGRVSHTYHALRDGCHFDTTVLELIGPQIHDVMKLNVSIVPMY